MAEAAPRNDAFWRSLEELHEPDCVLGAGRGEHPEGADRPELLSRRTFLQLSGASMALAGLGGCALTAPDEVIVPYRVPPPEVVPGSPLFYATAMLQGGYAAGLLVESHAGRPTKIEGNPEHPTNRGKSTVFEQAALLGLYDRGRAQEVQLAAAPSSFAACARHLVELFNERPSGAGVHLLLEPTTSPLVASLLTELVRRRPEIGISFAAPLTPHAEWAGSRIAFGAVTDPLHDLAAADVLFAAGGDPLARGPAHLPHARDFATRRKAGAATSERGMSRLYVAESAYSITGAAADERLALRTSELPDLVAAVFVELTRVVAAPDAARGLAAVLAARPSHGHERFARAVARDLAAHQGASLVLIGGELPPETHALGHAMNALLGASGKTTARLPAAILEAGGPSHDLAHLVDALGRGEVAHLAILGGDPAHTAPVDLDLAAAIARAKDTLHLAPTYRGATAPLCRWLLPEAHFLEAWGDGRAHDGTITLAQPLIRPLYSGKSVAETLALYLADTHPGRELLERATRSARPHPDFDAAWQAALARGFFADTAAPRLQPTLRWDDVHAAVAATPAIRPGALELVLSEDPRVYDGRYIDNPWLLELPAPLTTLTWDNAALTSPKTAELIGASNGDLVRLTAGEREIVAPILALPGHADDVVTLTLGWGQSRGDSPGNERGADAYGLRTSAAPYLVPNLRVTRTSETHDLALTQTHWTLEHRPALITMTKAEAAENASPVNAVMERPLTSFHNRVPDGKEQWGMSIDLSACLGCGACAIACQAENNIPVVGKPGVKKRREMHWLRIDRYFSGTPEKPRVAFQPMLCQQCEKAPCEYVCPVHATVHSPDGLNEMVYNRCVGTRFCSNNCPYKVRRFNWFNYHKEDGPLQKMLYNPDVTVRARGVMEKCTFCVQRIREAGIKSRLTGRRIIDGELQTACQQACPSDCIAFGDLADPNSRVVAERASDRDYTALRDLDTEPRLHYLARVTNPNPELES